MIYNPETTFVSADSHYFHRNIIKKLSKWKKGAIRDFDSVEQMNDVLVENYNAVLKPDFTLIFAGDWAFGEKAVIEFRERILCRNIIFIAGNHDHEIRRKKRLHSLFTRCYAEKDIYHQVKFKVGNYEYLIGHCAARVWPKNHYGVRHLYGHSHSSLPDNPNAMAIDIGIDCPYTNFRPINFIKVEELMKHKTFKPQDHHGERDE